MVPAVKVWYRPSGTMARQLGIHMIGKRGGIISFYVDRINMNRHHRIIDDRMENRVNGSQIQYNLR